MTKKDYILISNVLDTTIKIWQESKRKWIVKSKQNILESDSIIVNEKINDINIILASINVIAKGLAFELKKDNPKFDESKFFLTCGLTTIKIQKECKHGHGWKEDKCVYCNS